jgi:energy-coupling factor transporter ATP-binding protein EcfA2
MDELDVNMVNVVNVMGKILPDQTLIETIYDPNKGQAGLLVQLVGKEPIITSEFKINNYTYRPYIDDAIRKGLTILPSLCDASGSPHEILEKMRNAIRKYVELDPIYEEISARYVMLTWVYDRFDSIPYLRILGHYGTGKTRFISMMEELTYHSSRIGVAVTAPNIFRWLDKRPGTLLLDEADFSKTTMTDVMTQVLNGGYERRGIVTRNVGSKDGYTPTAFSMFGPKILASRHPFSDESLESRIITIRSKQNTRNDIPMNLPKSIEWDEMIELRNLLLGFRVENVRDIDTELRVKDLKHFEPRFQQIFSPLLQIFGETKLSPGLRDFADRNNEERLAHRFYGKEAQVIRAILRLRNLGDISPTIGKITDEINTSQKKQLNMHPRRVGSIVRGLGLRTRRKNTGFIIEPTIQELEIHANNFGIDCNLSNDNGPEYIWL